MNDKAGLFYSVSKTVAFETYLKIRRKICERYGLTEKHSRKTNSEPDSWIWRIEGMAKNAMMTKRRVLNRYYCCSNGSPQKMLTADIERI